MNQYDEKEDVSHDGTIVNDDQTYATANNEGSTASTGRTADDAQTISAANKPSIVRQVNTEFLDQNHEDSLLKLTLKCL